jgi:putative transposon-encoded protein
VKIEVRTRGGAIAALDEKGNPLMVMQGEVRNYGRGNQVYLPKEWKGRKVIVVDASDVR